MDFQHVSAERRAAPTCYIGGLKNRESFRLISRAGLGWLESRRLTTLPWLLHAFSTRRGGFSRPPVRGLNLGFVASDRRSNVRRNRLRFFEVVGEPGFSPASVRQIHSATPCQVRRGSGGELEFRPSGYAVSSGSSRQVPAGDALMTDERGILLSVRVADCLPVLLVDPQRPAVAAIHAGWRGGLQRVVEKTVGVMRRVFGSDPRHLLAALGPSIRACCCAVGQEVVDAFCGRFVNGEHFFRQPPADGQSQPPGAHHTTPLLSAQPPGHEQKSRPAAHLDLVAMAQDQLRHSGLQPANIFVAPFCTACRTDLFFSHRKEGARTGRFMSIIGIRPEPSRRVQSRVGRKG